MTCKQWKRLLTMDIYMSKRKSDHDLVVIRKSKVALTILNKLGSVY